MNSSFDSTNSFGAHPYLNADSGNSSKSSGSGSKLAYQSADAVVQDGIKHACQQLTMKLTDIHMASRRAAEAATRRADVATWLNSMFESLRLPDEPSEEDLRKYLGNGSILCQVMNKLNPGSIPKIVSNPSLTSAEGAAHSAYQRFENVRNFLVAIEDLKLQTFEASDLEQGNMVTVVDCLLSLKDYYEHRCRMDTPCLWKQGTEQGTSADAKFIGGAYPGKAAIATLKSGSQPRKRWTLPDAENNSVSDNQSEDHKGVKLPSKSFDAERLLSSPVMSDSTSGWIQHIGQKFQEALQQKARRYPDIKAIENSGMLNSLDNAPSQSFLSLVSAILGDKQNEEAPSDACLQLIEFMLRKVMEEFERRILYQGQQMKKLKLALREVLAREEKVVARANVLEALAAGSGQEIQLLADQLQKAKEEKMQMEDEIEAREQSIVQLTREKSEVEAKLLNLEEEFEKTKKSGHQQLHEMEMKKQESLGELEGRLTEMKLLLENSNRRNEELELLSAKETQTMKLKDSEYLSFIIKHLDGLQEMRAMSDVTREEIFKLQESWQSEFDNLGQELKGLANAASNYYKVLEENRQLYNQVQDLKGNIRVYCRVRPFLCSELERQTTIDYIGENGELIIVNPQKQGKDAQRMFKFNKVFGPSARQEEVFVDTQPLIRSVLDGYNVCIFAYGQTGSGKTFTMTGPNSSSKEDWGVNYRALNDLFEISQRRKDVFKYEVAVQMIEIYNEQVRDLLSHDSLPKKLEIRSISQPNGLSVPDAVIMPVESTSDVLDLMKIGQRNRAVGATALNERSSRSHSVLTVHVQGMDISSGAILRGCLHLIDLAGSERVDRSEVTGDRLREAQHINKSLSALGDVISSLANKSAHVPYRNSKLTQILQDSLGGRAKTLMFVQLNPDVESYSETISTLKFAERVSGVELGAARSNKESKEIRDFKEQIAQLKDVIARKDAEIERLQALKEPKDLLGNYDKHRLKPTYSPQRQNISVVGQGHRNMPQPLDVPMDEDFESASTADSDDVSSRYYPRPSFQGNNLRKLLDSKVISGTSIAHEDMASQQNDKIGKFVAGSRGNGMRKVPDVDNYLENANRNPDSGLQELSVHMPDTSQCNDRSFYQDARHISSYSSLESSQHQPYDVEVLGTKDADLDERLSEISDGDLSMGTETDVSVGSIVGSSPFPDKKEYDKLTPDNEKRRATPSRIPRPPLKSQQRALAQPQSKLMTYSSGGLGDSSRKKSSTVHTTTDSFQRKLAFQQSTNDSQRSMSLQKLTADSLQRLDGQRQSGNTQFLTSFASNGDSNIIKLISASIYPVL